MNEFKKLINLKKYADFGQTGNIIVLLDNEYYENGENAKIQKIIFVKI